MVKLFYYPAVCSLAPHIVLAEVGTKYEIAKVDLATHKLEDGTDYYTINPQGTVAALLTDDNQLLTEGVAIMQLIADSHPESKLIPPTSSFLRYRVVEALNFISTELHKGFVPLFKPDEEAKIKAKEVLTKKYAHVEKQLDGKEYFVGNSFTIADAYLFTVTSWAKMLNYDLSAFTNVQNYLLRIGSRPSVLKALKEEGLLKD